MSDELKETIKMRLTAIRYAAKDINFYEFCGMENQSLPAAAPGAHIGLHLPNGLVRQYSLITAAENPVSYTTGIKLDRSSRGGSSHIHRNLRVGDILDIEPPRNNFPLDESAAESVFLAGGIGITPIRAMIERLANQGRKWKLFYACRTRTEAAFFSELQNYPHVRFHFDDESVGFFDCREILAEASPEAHFYCCGPAAMLESFEKITAELPREQIHVEYFTPKYEAATDGGYTVELAREKRQFTIPAGKTILRVLLEAGIDIPFSCEEGVCGSCETRVVSGIPDHRDAILSDAEKSENKTMMICCSGSKSPLLILDL